MQTGIVGTLAFALRETSRPEVKTVRSALAGTILRIGDVDARIDEAIEISIKTSKCTALARPKGWKKFALRERKQDDEMDVDDSNEQDDDKATYVQLKMRSDYYLEPNPDDKEANQNMEIKEEDDEDDLLEEGMVKVQKVENAQRVEKEDLIRGFKYGTTYAPCPDGQFPRLNTRKGIDICGFFPSKNVNIFLVIDVQRPGVNFCMKISSVESCQWGKFSTFGRIRAPHENKLLYHRLQKL